VCMDSLKAREEEKSASAGRVADRGASGPWSARDLRNVLKSFRRQPQLIVVSNREPYAHNRLPDGRIEIRTGPGGLVTALEPLMRECSGLWIAHGDGSADREFVDAFDRVAVPPDHPSYVLQRLWLSSNEEKAYYCGFSNEGLWPLCHSTPVQPRFSESDWGIYKTVNSKFADAVAQDCRAKAPVVLVQDYHLALLPALLRACIPQAVLVLFWHVPWPQAEKLQLCPWRTEILMHMLGADIVGFNTIEHCRNFLASVDRYLPSAERREMTVRMNRRTCRVVAYPESVEWSPAWLSHIPSVAASRVAVKRQYRIAPHVIVGLGIDRWDFTKGIPEKILAFETFLERNPHRCGSVTLLQVASPSRTRLSAYRSLQRQTLRQAERVNRKLARADWKPIVLVPEEQRRQDVYRLYRGADFCWVNSLDDGMNLVAKEFVTARDDEDGVLVLSRRAGAAEELKGALLTDPICIPAVAATIETALNMSQRERRKRMRSMRRTVETNDVYRWAGRILADAQRVSRGGAL
jgi:trehalose-6-phosphate synthase